MHNLLFVLFLILSMEFSYAATPILQTDCFSSTLLGTYMLSSRLIASHMCLNFSKPPSNSKSSRIIC
ncbi:ORF392 [White spot syndrome virus]|uniref:ORF392 n=1 Tax=White spot syndrome virus TaxID=342409 RepID=A0A2D3I6Q8_9VIRU|nr:ORF392 [White spot syndrome virus]